jgi:hypothetical protein
LASDPIVFRQIASVYDSKTYFNDITQNYSKLYFLLQLKKLGEMKDQYDELNEAEQFACSVSFIILYE